ncbi:hypothetical protein HG530_011305 [Fusarium avenaceum]|nr:hypothetical protein HG530_011305 [Fusarium avenaceum]
MTDRELHLITIRAQRKRNSHDTSIVNNNIDAGHVAPAVDLFSSLAHRRQRAKVYDKRARLDIGIGFGDGFRKLLELGGVAAGEDQELWGLGGGF